MHRLNRTEYVNAVRDLLALEIDGRVLLPADDSGFGFDNNADVLTMSPALLDRYLAAATRIARLAVGDPALRPAVAKYDAPRAARQQERTSEALPFGTRGGLSVRHTFPLDGEYLIKVRLRRDGDYGIAGLDRGDRLEIRLDRRRIATFTVGGDAELRGLTYDSQEPIPPDRPDLLRRKIYDNTADEGLEVRLPVPAGTRRVGAAFARYAGVAEAGGRLNRAPAVESVEILGPYDASPPAATPSRERIFTCRPARPEEETPCAREILAALARRAFRRPVAAADIDVLLQFHAAGRAAGTFDSGIQAALERLLVDPEFLFRIEHDPPGLAAGTVHALSDLELASRLSFFLWSSLPDDELLAVAERGALGSPGGLEGQVRRMLADPRAAALVDNFASQWLLVRNVRFAEPDRALFPGFDGDLREALARETELFFHDQFRRDRSVLDLLRSDYTFVNSRLAEHYGIPGIYGGHFRRVTLEDERRHGLLGHGSVLTVTSYPNRTSPVLRGKWVLENLLGAPPPPAAARRAVARGGLAGHADDRARAARAASRESGLRELPRADGSAGLRPGELRSDRPLARRRGRPAHRRQRRSARRLDGGRPGRLPPGAARAGRGVRRELHRKADDVRAGTRRRAPRRVGRAGHRARCRRQRLPLVGHPSGHRGERAVPDAQGAAIMIITRQ